MRKNEKPLIGANPLKELDLSDFPLVNRLPIEMKMGVSRVCHDDDLQFDERSILNSVLTQSVDVSLTVRYVHETFEGFGTCRAARVIRSLKREGYVVQFKNQNYAFARPARDYIREFVNPIKQQGIFEMLKR